MNGVRAFWDSTIGKKVVMAVTGVFMALWVLGHLSGNLLVFKGSEAMNHYAEFLHSIGTLLWLVRFALIGAVILHIVAATQLTLAANAARPQGYAMRKPQVSTLASRTMRVGGVLLLVYIVFHLLHFTFGTLHPSFDGKNVYGNVVVGFQNPLVSAFYLVSMAALGMHLFHGIWSSWRTLGLSKPSPNPLHRRVALVVAIVVWLGFSAIPVAVLAGIVR